MSKPDNIRPFPSMNQPRIAPMFSPSADPMTRDEKRAGASLAAIFALRMLGLFLILPVFAVHAQSIPGGDNLTMVGIVLGAYGLTQSMLQIAFGAASDRYGRKRVIIIGLVIFSIGSFVAALAPDIYWVIAGRILQGAGAISAAVTALAADLTREQHRTKVMAMIGSSIGLVFALSLVIAPILYQAIGMGGLFGLTGTLALAAILLVLYVVPESPPSEPHEMGPIPFAKVAFDIDEAKTDFAQLTNRTKYTHGETFKYDGSYEEIGLLIKRFVPAAAPALEKFFQLVVFNYVISNGDAHLKNFSLLRNDTGEYQLTPAYDLMSTVIHTPQESDTALDLYEGDMDSKFYSKYGYYGRENFMELARRLGIIEKRAERIIDQFTAGKEQVNEFVQNSFLSPEVKKIYITSFADKVKRI